MGESIDVRRSQLVHLLEEAVEVEHMLMCQYLFAAASLKSMPEEFPEESEGSPHPRCEYETVRRWKVAILRVAREEMQHMAWAINLLIAVGGAPVLGRRNFPNRSRYYRKKPGARAVPMTLRKFDFETARRFIRLEAPRPVEPTVEAGAVVDASGFVLPEPIWYSGVGPLYLKIRELLTPDTVIVPAELQYEPRDSSGQPIQNRYRPPFYNTVRTWEDARRLVDKIVEHGEGASDPESHLNMFCAIAGEYKRRLRANPKFRPFRDVIDNPMLQQHLDADKGANIIDASSLAYKPLRAFNTAYELLLLWLSQLFGARGSAEERRAIESLTFLPLMTEVIGMLADLLTELPISATAGAKTAGPSFEVTSGEAVFPDSSVILQLSREKLEQIVLDLGDAEKQLKTSALPQRQLDRLIDDVSYAKRSVELMIGELESRVRHGWPPRAADVRARARATASPQVEAAPENWLLEFSQRYIEFEFQGWCQIRLPTEPDRSSHRRGVSGGTMAGYDEPDLDRVIRLQRTATTPQRKHCPPVGVALSSCRLMEAGTTVGEYDCSGKVDLLSEPKFLGRNHIVSEDGEPIDPFEIQLRDDRGDLCLQRRTAGELGLEDVSPLDRRATGRYPVALLRADAVTLEQHLAIANELAGRRAGGEEESGVGEQHLAIANELAGAPEHRSLPAYLEERIQRLREDLSPTDPDVEASTAERVRLLEQTRPGTMLWRRFFFQACYRHFVSGVVTHQKLPGAWGLKVIQSERWLVEYRLGFYDSDAMAALIWGTLRVPVRKRDA